MYMRIITITVILSGLTACSLWSGDGETVRSIKETQRRTTEYNKKQRAIELQTAAFIDWQKKQQQQCEATHGKGYMIQWYNSELPCLSPAQQKQIATQTAQQQKPVNTPPPVEEKK